MTKEDLLAEMKELVVLLKNDGQQLMADPELAEKYKARTKSLQEEVNNLGDGERTWVNSQYSVWYNKHILPEYKDLVKEIEKNGDVIKAQLRNAGLNIP